MAKSNKGRKFFATTATAALVASAIVPVASAAQINDFNSISSYAQEAVQDLNDRGIIKGDQKGNFNPKSAITRAEAATILANALELEGSGSTSFTDVKKSAWYYDAIDAAVANGIFQGQGAGKFNPSANLTRSEAAIILVDAFGLEGTADLKEFKDEASVKSWAEEALSIAVKNGVMKGDDNGNLKPNASITRQDFALMYYRTEAAEGTEEVSGSVKAINNTTVEVTFTEEVEDVKALDFAIEGLDVTNAVVKQTNKKTVVLTTSAQTADVVYTVTVNGEKVGTFKGVSAVIPTKVELVSSSVQGKLGQQVSVKAKVTVADGQSKAGIPVTFNVPGKNDAVLPTVTGEAFTDENGVATYTYTRYNAVNDQVTAYATGDRSKFALGYVFWGVEQILTITEVTEGTTINNGANKTYKVTYKNPTTGKPQANVTLNVGALENMNVTADKLQNVKINGTEVAQLSNNTVTKAAQITTDSKGEATFTVSGTNSEVTPVVFEANNGRNANGTTYQDYKYDASDLQTTAAKVKFAAVQAEYVIEVTRDGGEVAATGEANGREYKILVKDKAGNVAKNETVNVAFNEDLDRVIATNTKAGFVNTDTDTFYPETSAGNKLKQISVKTNDKGEASFTIASKGENDYATPVAWIDINTSNAKQGALDEGEPKTVAAISHFQAPYLDGAEIKAYKVGASKPTTKFDSAEPAIFKAELVNQSGKVFTGGYTVGNVTYTVTNTGADDVKVGSTIISPNRSETFTQPSGASITVESADNKTTSVKVVATGIAYKDGKDLAFTAKEATATFTNAKTVATPHTGYAVKFNTADTGTDSNSIWFDGKNPVKYTGDKVKYYGANGNEIFGETAWEIYLDSLVGSDVQISYSKDGETTNFKVISVSAGTSKKLVNVTPPPTVTPDQELGKAISAGKATFDAGNADSKYSTASWDKFAAAYTAAEEALASKTATDAEKTAAAKALTEAQAALEGPEAPAETVITSAKAFAPNSIALGLDIFTDYEVTGTVAEADATKKVELKFGFADETVEAVTATVDVKDGKFAYATPSSIFEYAAKTVTLVVDGKEVGTAKAIKGEVTK